MRKAVSTIIDKLALAPHPEGGYFRETYRSAFQVKTPPRFVGGERDAGTCIHYMLTVGDFSAWHRIQGDETWVYEAGSPLTVYWIGADGCLHRSRLGHVLHHEGTVPQLTVPNNCWFAAVLEPDDVLAAEPYGLVACAVYPGFDFQDFQFGDREELLATYPQHAAFIERFSHQT